MTESSCERPVPSRDSPVPSGDLPLPELPLPELPYGLSYGWPEPEGEDAEDLWLRFEPTEVLAVRVTSPQSLKYWGHWYPAARAMRLCQARRDRAGRILLTQTCTFCLRPASPLPAGKPLASPSRLRHLLTVELPDGRQRIWEFSDTVAQQLQVLQQAAGGDLAGLRLLLRRVPPKPNGAVIVSADPDPEAWGELPPPLDAASHVIEGWRRAALRDGKAPPTLPLSFG